MALSTLLHRGFWVFTGNVIFALEGIQLIHQLLFLEPAAVYSKTPFSSKHFSPTLGGRSRSLRPGEAQRGGTSMDEKEQEVDSKVLVSSSSWFISIYV